MKIRVLTLISVCLLLLAACQSSTKLNATAQVKRVLSGQTLEVQIVSGLEPSVVKIRLNGINAPDFQQKPWGKQAKQGLEKLLTPKQANTTIGLELASSQRDRYQRLAAYLWYDDILVNEQLIAEGYVLADLNNSGKYTQRFQNAQEYARIMGYGIWNPQQPLRLTPQEFRIKGNGE